MNVHENIPTECFHSICRVCLLFADLFGVNDFTWDGAILKDVMDVLIPGFVQENDLLPQNICKSCIKKAYNAYNFVISCQESTNVLNRILTRSDVIVPEKLEVHPKEELPIPEEFCSDTESSPDVAPVLDEDDPDDPSVTKSELEENQVHQTKNPDISERNPNILIYTIKSIKNELEEIKVKNREKIYRLRKSQLISNRVKPKRPYVKSKGPPYVCITCHSSFNDYEDLRTHKIETKHRKARKFICPYCQRRHDAYSKYLEHVRTHTGEKPNSCPTCGKGFNFKTDLRRHMVLHSEVKPYNCRFCDRGFSRKQYLNDHERKHTGERLICSFCGKGFHSYSTLAYHEKSHKGPPGVVKDVTSKQDKYYVCQICDKHLLTEQTLKSHILLHGPKNFNCEKCGKTFITKNRLHDHIRFAHQDRLFPCTKCDKVYKQKNGLEIHMKSHTGENIYPCEVCNKQFACKGSLYQHRRVHTGDTRYQCKECYHICVNKRHLENHLRTHTGEKPFQCAFCGKSFAQKANMSAHVKLHTGEKRHLCRICGKGFHDARGLRKHLVGCEKNSVVGAVAEGEVMGAVHVAAC